jgi:putative membrane protein
MRERDDAWKGIVAGAVAGLAASWVMNRYQEVESKVVTRIKQSRQSKGERAMELGREAQRGPERQGETTQAYQSAQAEQRNEEQKPSTLKVAEVISIKVAHHQLTEREEKIAEPMVHYAFGTLTGAWYGVLSAITPVTTAGRGAAYGAVVWLGADEISLTALGIAKSPFEYPLSSHVSALSAHLVYGLALDAGRRVLLKAMGAEESRSARSSFDWSRVQDILAGEDWSEVNRRAGKTKEQVRNRYKATYRVTKRAA